MLSITGSLKDTIGAWNPFRYRGYYYDNETGMYYVKSRYYEPVLRRFVSADELDTLDVQNDLYDKNLYAYCDGNPQMLDLVQHLGNIKIYGMTMRNDIILFFIGSLISFFANRLNLKYLSEQIMIISAQRLFLCILISFCNELDMKRYPFKEQKNVPVSAFFKKKLLTKYDVLPFEIILLEKTINFGCIIVSILLWTRGFLVSDELDLFTGGYVCCAGTIMVVVINKFRFILFRKIFKRCTLQNWWYIIAPSDNVPRRDKLGVCVIVKKERKLRRIYYTVQVKKSGNVYNKVMYCGEGQCKTDREHTLYEIRGVRYIM